MSLDLTRLRDCIEQHGPIVRVVVAAHQGSTPRETGTDMFVWSDGQHGTIGGGALEYRATSQARAMLAQRQKSQVQHVPLGPGVGQCCGGAVTLVFEAFDDAHAINSIPSGPVFARPVLASASPQCPMQTSVTTGLVEGWLFDRLENAQTPVWIYGAGHVGRALAGVLAPIPDLTVTLVDTTQARLMELPSGALPLLAQDPARAARGAPDIACHFVMSYSHDLDLQICEALVARRFQFAGLIGSKTKWARFRKRLEAAGHEPRYIQRLTCPIGDPRLGKHPQQIALGVAAALLSDLENPQIIQEAAQ